MVAAGGRRGKGGGSECLGSGDSAGRQSPGSGANSISSKTGEEGTSHARSHILGQGIDALLRAVYSHWRGQDTQILLSESARRC